MNLPLLIITWSKNEDIFRVRRVDDIVTIERTDKKQGLHYGFDKIVNEKDDILDIIKTACDTR